MQRQIPQNDNLNQRRREICPTCGQPVVNRQHESKVVEPVVDDAVDREALLATLDDETARALREHEINETVALRLAKHEDVSERLKILKLAREHAAQRIAGLMERAEEQLRRSEEEASRSRKRKLPASRRRPG